MNQRVDRLLAADPTFLSSRPIIPDPRAFSSGIKFMQGRTAVRLYNLL